MHFHEAIANLLVTHWSKHKKWQVQSWAFLYLLFSLFRGNGSQYHTLCGEIVLWAVAQSFSYIVFGLIIVVLIHELHFPLLLYTLVEDVLFMNTRYSYRCIFVFPSFTHFGSHFSLSNQVVPVYLHVIINYYIMHCLFALLWIINRTRGR